MSTENEIEYDSEYDDDELDEAEEPVSTAVQPLTPQELRQYQNETLLMDDDYSKELRLQVAHYGEALLSRTHYEVDLLEQEFVALSAVFNEFLDEVKLMDKKIGDLSNSINQGKMRAAKELDQTIKQEVQTVVEQLRLLPRADLSGVEILYQNLDSLQDNYQVLEEQIRTLDEIGVKTDPIKKNLPALEKGLQNFGKSIEERQMTLLVGEQEKEEKIDYDILKQELTQMVVSQRRAMINHLRQSQTLATPKEVDTLRKNQAGFEKNYQQILEQIVLLKEAGQDMSDLESDIQPIASGLQQFEKAIASNQYLKFTQKLYEEVEVINEQIQDAYACTLAEDLEILQENVDALFENCDAFAEELDELAEQGLNIDSLIEHYDVLRLTVEQFERVVQESANRLGLTSGSIT